MFRTGRAGYSLLCISWRDAEMYTSDVIANISVWTRKNETKQVELKASQRCQELLPRLKWPENEDDHSLHLLHRLRLRKLQFPFPCLNWGRVEGNFYVVRRCQVKTGNWWQSCREIHNCCCLFTRGRRDVLITTSSIEGFIPLDW
jgi:hypothetical protein